VGPECAVKPSRGPAAGPVNARASVVSSLGAILGAKGPGPAAGHRALAQAARERV